LAKKHDTGGIFWVEDLEREQQRFENKEISFTAPMYGYKMKDAKYDASELEDRVLSSFNVDKKDFRRNHVKGTRRNGRLLPEIIIDDNKDGLELSFMLPKGAYATTVLREFMKPEESII
jgi:tRNA pseudouridine13 synthase